MKIKQAGDIFYGRFSIFEDKAGFEAAVSCRKGGSSPAPFDTLNMSFSAGDNPEHVRDNRKRFLQLLGIPSDQIISCHQVHGIHLEQVGAEYCGRGALDPDDALPACDGLLTNESNVPLTMNFADCMPLVFYDPVRRAAALSHADGEEQQKILQAVRSSACRKSLEVFLGTYWQQRDRPSGLPVLRSERMCGKLLYVSFKKSSKIVYSGTKEAENIFLVLPKQTAS